MQYKDIDSPALILNMELCTDKSNASQLTETMYNIVTLGNGN